MMRIVDWNSADSAARAAAVARPAQRSQEETTRRAREIIASVRADGDAALRRLTRELDGVEIDSLKVPDEERANAHRQLTPAQLGALKRAIENVDAFHSAQMPPPLSVETMPGVRCERIVRPVESVGLYVPAGSAPLPSAVVMLAVPARIAGCPRRVLCTPPQRDGRAHAAVLVAADLCGIDAVYRVGGAQAIAALAYGTETVSKVQKIFGPGNAWVTAAKQLVASDADGAAIDLPAGPSEVLVIADDSARAEFVAADLLAQAEHDAQSQAILVTTSRALAEAVARAVEEQRRTLSRSSMLERSLVASRCIVAPDLETALDISNAYAPEHLILQVRDARAQVAKIRSAGSVFVGEWSPEPLGDYCSGTNHVLPTYGHARAYSGLSVHDFLKRITVQELTAAGLSALGPTAVELALLEGLDAHANAVRRRLDAIEAASLDSAPKVSRR